MKLQFRAFIIIQIFIVLFTSVGCVKTSPSNISVQDELQLPNDNIKQIFSTVDKSILLNLLISKNETEAKKLLTPLANKINAYLFNKYNIRIESNSNVNEIILIGLAVAKKEHQLSKQDIQNNSLIYKKKINKQPELDCFISVVGGIIGIADARALYLSFSEGVAAETIIAAVKLIGKRVAASITIVFAVYELGECMEWW